MDPQADKPLVILNGFDLCEADLIDIVENKKPFALDFETYPLNPRYP